jgi:hypothetical protein
VIDKLTAKDRPAACRARLTGGWDRGRHDRGSIGLRILTGRRPAIWNGRVAFPPDRPFHEHHQVQPLAGPSAEQWPKDKAVVGLGCSSVSGGRGWASRSGSVVALAPSVWVWTACRTTWAH